MAPLSCSGTKNPSWCITWHWHTCYLLSCQSPSVYKIITNNAKITHNNPTNEIAPTIYTISTEQLKKVNTQIQKGKLWMDTPTVDHELGGDLTNSLSFPPPSPPSGGVLLPSPAPGWESWQRWSAWAVEVPAIPRPARRGAQLPGRYVISSSSSCHNIRWWWCYWILLCKVCVMREFMRSSHDECSLFEPLALALFMPCSTSVWTLFY